VYLETIWVGSRGMAECVVGAGQVIFFEAGMWEKLFFVDELPACRRSRTMERGKSKCSTVGTLFAARF